MNTKYWLALALLASACSKGGTSAGAEDGPASIVVADLTISTLPADIQKGQEIFATKGCAACHKVGGGKLVGPDLQGVTARRSVKWLQKMILKPEVMLQEDAAAKEMLKTHMTPMPNQNVTPDVELPAILAYLKAHEK